MAVVHIEVKDYTPQYLNEIKRTVGKATEALGKDLESTAKAAAPEKTGNLMDNIVLSYSQSSGAYQADVESTAVDPVDGEYANWMHSGKPSYKLGKVSAAKGMASSKLGGIRKRVGPGYLQGTGTAAKKGYQAYMIREVDLVNRRYNK